MAQTNVIKPHPGGQTIALESSEDEILCGGKRGGGKTDVGLMWMMEPEYIKNPKFQGLVVRQDANDLDDWLMRARAMYTGLGEIVGNPPFVRWNSGAITRTGHWKDKSTISKYQGKEYQKMLLEELTQGIRTLDEYKMLRASCRSSIPELSPQMMANTNPGGPGHRWVKDYWIEVAERELCQFCHGEGCDECGGEGARRTGRIITTHDSPYTDPVTGLSRVYIPFGVEDNPSLPESYTKQLNDLPEPLRSAWRYGLWDVLEGQFFGQVGRKEAPWNIGPERSAGRLFGSLDIGITHATSFGLWYIDTYRRFHRLFTYNNKLGSHEAHAWAIRDKIQGFNETGGVFPNIIWAGHDAWTKLRGREDHVESAIDIYKEVFTDPDTKRVRSQFVRANIDRRAGCMAMREAFEEKDGLSQVSYWGKYNKSYEDELQAMMTDKNDPETYEKLKDGGDDTADDVRYGVMGCRSFIGNERRSQQARGRRTPIIDTRYNDIVSAVAETALG